jgi:molybdate-binding protein
MGGELARRRLVVVTLSQWQQGLIVARGNPKGITSPAERYDLVIPMEFLPTASVQALLDVVASPCFRAELEALGGYDGSRAGTVVAELGA